MHGPPSGRQCCKGFQSKFWIRANLIIDNYCICFSKYKGYIHFCMHLNKVVKSDPSSYVSFLDVFG